MPADTLRAAVLAEMKRRKMNANQLALLLDGQMNRQTVYNLVTGAHAITSDKMSQVFKVLGLRVACNARTIRSLSPVSSRLA